MAPKNTGSFSVEVREARERLGLSVRRAAAKADISEGRWRQLERGFQRVGRGDDAVDVPANPSRVTVRKVADVLHLDPGTLLRLAGHEDGTDQPPVGAGERSPTAVEDALRNDSSLFPEARALLLHAYQVLTNIPDAATAAVLQQAHEDLAAQPPKTSRQSEVT